MSIFRANTVQNREMTSRQPNAVLEGGSCKVPAKMLFPPKMTEENKHTKKMTSIEGIAAKLLLRPAMIKAA